MEAILSKDDMKQIQGGVSGREYCSTLQEIANGEYAKDNWTCEEWDNWADAWEAHCIQ